MLDANDNAPEWLQPAYTARVDAGSTPGVPILRLAARDPDDGENGRVSYSLKHQTGQSSVFDLEEQKKPLFHVDPQTGVLSLARSLPVPKVHKNKIISDFSLK